MHIEKYFSYYAHFTLYISQFLTQARANYHTKLCIWGKYDITYMQDKGCSHTRDDLDSR